MTEAAPIPRRHWFAMGTLALGVSLVIMDATIVNVALPVVIEDLGLDSSGAQWMNAIYSLVFASLMLTVGRFGDLYGRKRLFTAGLVLFMAASLFAGASVNPAMLIGSRLVQGLGAAMVLPSTLSTLNAMFQGRERGIAFAIWGSTIGGMAAVGPLLGGWLATDVSWRWAFWLNIPFGLLGVALALWFVDPDVPRHDAPQFDVVGLLLMAAAFGGLLGALEMTGKGLLPWPAMAAWGWKPCATISGAASCRRRSGPAAMECAAACGAMARRRCAASSSSSRRKGRASPSTRSASWSCASRFRRCR